MTTHFLFHFQSIIKKKYEIMENDAKSSSKGLHKKIEMNHENC